MHRTVLVGFLTFGVAAAAGAQGQGAPARAQNEPALWDAPAAAAPASPGAFMVQGVDRGDTLNLRARADSKSALVGKIPPDGRGVRATGRREQSGTSSWWEVSYEGRKGWVNARFLVPESGAPPPAAPVRPAPAPVPTTRPLAPAKRSAAAPIALEPPRPQLAPDPYGAPGGGGAPGLPEDMVCFLNRPIWRIELRRDGNVSCTEMCKAPPGLHTVAAATPPLKNGWSYELRGSDGAAFMSLSVRRTGKCVDEMSSKSSSYEVTAKRPRGSAYKGCCDPVTARR